MAKDTRLYNVWLFCDSYDLRTDMTKTQIQNYINEINCYNTIPGTSCLRSIKLDFEEKKETLVIISLPEGSPKFTSKTDTKCVHTYIKLKKSKCSSSCDCLKNLRNGNCKDDFVRKHIGAKLFKDKYNEKQK